MAREEIVRRAWREFEPELQEQGYELIEVEYVGTQGGMHILRLYIDKSGGITLDDCTAVSQLLNPLLDAGDFIHENYFLEVSSPGIDRPLRKPQDFQKYVGEEVRVVTHSPTDGRKKFSGVLNGFVDGLIKLDCDGVCYEIHIENLKKANLNR